MTIFFPYNATTFTKTSEDKGGYFLTTDKYTSSEKTEEYIFSN
jgi:hypothetical protein